MPKGKKERIDKEKEFYRLKYEYRNRVAKDGFRVGNQFEEWWEAVEQAKESRKKIYPERAAVGIYWDIDRDITNNVIPRIRHKRKRNARVSDFKKLSLEEFTGWPWTGYLAIKVRAIGESMADLVDEFRRVIREELNKPEIKKVKKTLEERSGKKKIIYRSKARLDELRRYLEVYDLKEKGLTFKEIAKKFGYPDPDENILRAFKEDLRKAKTILRNHVKNTRDFPGKY